MTSAALISLKEEGKKESYVFFEDRIEGGGGHIVRLCLVKHSLWMRLKQWNQESRRQILNLLLRVPTLYHAYFMGAQGGWAERNWEEI